METGELFASGSRYVSNRTSLRFGLLTAIEGAVWAAATLIEDYRPFLPL